MKTLFAPVVVFLGLLACGGKTSKPEVSVSQSLPVETVSVQDTTINFESSATGQAPAGFMTSFTGREQVKDWKVIDDNGNKVVAQLAKNEGNYYNLLVLDKPQYKDLTLSVKIKAVSGNEDQGGGLVWRYVDSNNYYIARYNPLENNLRFYRVVDGSRKQLKSVDSDIPARVWFTMSIEMKGNKISCSLNGQKLIEATDDTFTEAGQVGLWTKADAVSYFDEVTAEQTN
jgi:hypothetical protein